MFPRTLQTCRTRRWASSRKVDPIGDAERVGEGRRPSVNITGRYARLTNYISPLGNFADQAVMPVGKITDDWYIVSGVDVLSELERQGEHPAQIGNTPLLQPGLGDTGQIRALRWHMAY
jgi:hypothetical protein